MQPAPILLADTSRQPTVTISWETPQGPFTITGQRPYRSPADKRPIGRNLDCYLALGGTRLERAAGDPDGAVLRVGLYKTDPKRPLFENLAENSQISVTLSGIVMNQPAEMRPRTALMHLRYDAADLQSCGLSADARNLYITVDPGDRVLSTVTPESARPGWLDGSAPDRGTVTTSRAADGSLSVTFRFPYALLRHPGDPSRRDVPGGFFEPPHFHLEIEAMPLPAPERK